MTHYQALIATAVRPLGDDYADPILHALVENTMRVDRTGLDYLSAREFGEEARDTAVTLRHAEPDLIALLCSVDGLPQPAWATA